MCVSIIECVCVCVIDDIQEVHEVPSRGHAERVHRQMCEGMPLSELLRVSK